MTLHRLVARLRAFQRDEGGNTIVSFAVVFPIVLVVVFGSAALIQILWLKIMLSSGVYDAVQNIAYVGGDTPYEQWPSKFGAESKEIIRTRLPQGNFLAQYIPGGSDGSTVEVTVQRPRSNGRRTPCELAAPGTALDRETLRFTVRANLDITPTLGIPYLGKISSLTLTEEGAGFLDCPRWKPKTKSEGCIFPGFCPPNQDE
ncbi:MAG: pilus assembly protein [Anaerolineae bacterium]|nr:pilus assembly protein [Anaerolineae bacterium]